MPPIPTPSGFAIGLCLALIIPIAFLSRLAARRGHPRFLFAYLAGSVTAAVLIAFGVALTHPTVSANPFLVALGSIAVVGLWKFLFHPGGAPLKAAVLGTVLFWISVHKLEAMDGAQRIATLIAAAIAIVPAILWCVLFVHSHRQRLSAVIVTFFAGMLSTAPILLYDHLVRSGAELHFFLFRITPENFLRSSETFVTHLTGEPGIVSSNVLVTLVSFAIVGVIEEWSKHWVTRKSDRTIFSSIDDVIQLSIVAAIGFAFAENIVNPNYFVAFVRNYLVTPSTPQWGIFFGSIIGRSVITNMVHIVSSGILGYYYGRAFFAAPVLLEDRARGKRRPLTSLLHRLFGTGRDTIYRNEMMLKGLLGAIGIHSLFDILVSIPEIAPGNPNTIGELIGVEGVLSTVSIVFVPAALYVIGGYYLLSRLLRKRADVQEHGHRITQDVFVPDAGIP